MSALGHKRTYALQKNMSALPPIATAKADIERLYARNATGPLALSCPLMSARSSKLPSRSRILGCGRARTCVPLKWLASWIRDCAAMISISGLAQAASAPDAAGQINPCPRPLAPIAAGNTPATGAIDPSRPSSPRTVKLLSASCGMAPIAASEHDRQIVMTSFFRQIGGSEIDGDAARRQREAGSNERRAHPLLGLRHSLVRQPHDGEGRQAGRHLHLHVDGTGLDSLKGNCRDALNHTTAPGPDARISSIEARRGLLVPISIE